MALNAFRVLLFSAVALIAWFAFTSERESRLRRAPIEPIPEFCTSGGKVAVTFDEGPGPVTQSVLQALKNSKIKATFHFVTRYFNQVSVVTNVEAAYRDGHLIGLRFPTTIDPNSLSDDELASILVQESQKIFNIIGKHPKYLRLPLGQLKDSVYSVAQRLGFIITRWNVDSNDFGDVKADNIVQTYRNQMDQVSPGAGRYIGLHRDLYNVYYDQTVLSKMGSLFAEKKYESVTLDVCVGQGDYRERNVDLQGGTAQGTQKGDGIDMSAARSDIFSVFALAVTLFFVML